MNTHSQKIRTLMQHSQHRWNWFLILGAILAVIGILALANSAIASAVSVALLGWLILLGGLFQLAAAIQSRGSGRTLGLLLFGVLDLIIGWMLLRHPEVGMLAITMLLAVWFIFTGILRISHAFAYHHPHYQSGILTGAISVILGILLWLQWPFSATWFIGFAVGLNFLIVGITWISFALALRKLARKG